MFVLFLILFSSRRFFVSLSLYQFSNQFKGVSSLYTTDSQSISLLLVSPLKHEVLNDIVYQSAHQLYSDKLPSVSNAVFLQSALMKRFIVQPTNSTKPTSSVFNRKVGQSPFSNSHPIAQYLQALKSFYRFGLTHFQNSNIISQLEQVSTKKGKPECNFKYRDIRTVVNWSDFCGNPRGLREQGNMLIYPQDKGYFWDKYGGTRDIFPIKGTLTGPPISLGEIYPYQSSSK